MAIKEITAKTILSSIKHPDSLFGHKYTINVYRGCEHQCIYCDSRSECYQIEDFSDLLVKVNAPELLNQELSTKKTAGTIITGAMSDPYTISEAELKMTRKALEIIALHKYPVHIITKSDMIVRDIDVLKEIGRVYSAVSLTITAADDALAEKLEPKAPVTSKRLRAIERLSTEGVYAGITMMPILPFIEDTDENIIEIIKMAAESGAKYIIPSFGVTLRDRQRAYFYKRLDELFPDLRKKYEMRYKESYGCSSDRKSRLKYLLHNECSRYGIQIGMKHYENQQEAEQLSFL